MTPAIELAKQYKISFSVHEYVHDTSFEGGYGLEAAQALNQSPDRIFKTLLVMLDGVKRHLAVAIIPVDSQLNLKAIAKACEAKKADMADPLIAERTTGYLRGGISPLGQKKLLPTLLDDSALGFPTIFVSAGRRGLEIELSAADLLQLCEGKACSIKR